MISQEKAIHLSIRWVFTLLVFQKLIDSQNVASGSRSNTSRAPIFIGERQQSSEVDASSLPTRSNFEFHNEDQPYSSFVEAKDVATLRNPKSQRPAIGDHSLASAFMDLQPDASMTEPEIEGK